MTTSKKAKIQFTLPELHDDRLIEWNSHVANDLGNYDMIIGRDILEFLSIDLRFSTKEVEWDCRIITLCLSRNGMQLLLTPIISENPVWYKMLLSE